MLCVILFEGPCFKETYRKVFHNYHHRLILNKYSDTVILLADGEGLDQREQMRNLIQVFAPRICQKEQFRLTRANIHLFGDCTYSVTHIFSDSVNDHENYKMKEIPD